MQLRDKGHADVRKEKRQANKLQRDKCTNRQTAGKKCSIKTEKEEPNKMFTYQQRMNEQRKKDRRKKERKKENICLYDEIGQSVGTKSQCSLKLFLFSYLLSIKMLLNM